MTNTKRWLDELPLESHERELLLVGKSARPAAGAIDANWQAICAALGTAAAGSLVATSAAANTASASAKVGSSMIVSKAASTGLVVAAAKSLAVGAAIGLAVMGASTAIEPSFLKSKPSASPNNPSSATTARRAIARPVPSSVAVPSDPASVASVTSSSGPSPSSAPPRERIAVSANVLTPVPAPPLSAMSPEARSASLAQQARELAELKRLIDSGAANEALRRLNDHFNDGTASLLSEERDALYVQALARAERRDEALVHARQFLARYPHSPYSETMRKLLNEK